MAWYHTVVAAGEAGRLNRRSKIIMMTPIFLVTQIVPWYYLINIYFFVYDTGMRPAAYYLLPGIDYILKTFFPVYYNAPVSSPGGGRIGTNGLGAAYIGAYDAGGTFMILFQLALTLVIVVSIALYVPRIFAIWRWGSRLNSRRSSIIWATGVFLTIQLIDWYIYFRMWLFGYGISIHIGGLSLVLSEIFLAVLLIVAGSTVIFYYRRLKSGHTVGRGTSTF